MHRPFIRATTFLTKHTSEQLIVTVRATRENVLRARGLEAMSGGVSKPTGHPNSLRDAGTHSIPMTPSATRRSISGSMWMPETSSHTWCELTRSENDADTAESTENPIFLTVFLSPSVPRPLKNGKSPDTGKQTRPSRVKAWRRCKSALSERLDLPSSPSCSGKELAP